MKINASKLIFSALKYWMANGKTMTALIVGIATGLIAQAGIDISADDLDALMQLIPFLGLLGVGVADKIRKTFKKIAADQEDEG